MPGNQRRRLSKKTIPDIKILDKTIVDPKTFIAPQLTTIIKSEKIPGEKYQTLIEMKDVKKLLKENNLVTKYYKPKVVTKVYNEDGELEVKKAKKKKIASKYEYDENGDLIENQLNLEEKEGEDSKNASKDLKDEDEDEEEALESDGSYLKIEIPIQVIQKEIVVAPQPILLDDKANIDLFFEQQYKVINVPEHQFAFSFSAIRVFVPQYEVCNYDNQCDEVININKYKFNFKLLYRLLTMIKKNSQINKNTYQLLQKSK